jgi:hypothetical protein
MTMSNLLLIVFVVMALVPVLVYVVTKVARVAFLQGTKFFEEKEKNDGTRERQPPRTP